MSVHTRLSREREVLAFRGLINRTKFEPGDGVERAEKPVNERNYSRKENFFPYSIICSIDF